MWTLGDKIASSIVAQTSDVPTLPWSGSDLRVAWTDEDTKKGKKIIVNRDLYDQACVRTVEEGLKVNIFLYLVYWQVCIVLYGYCTVRHCKRLH